MPIELPGYKAVFDNAVYARDMNLQAGNGEHVPFKRIILPRRFTEPTENQVVSYLQNRAAELEAAASIIVREEYKRNGKSALDMLLLKLPMEQRIHLRTGDPGCVEFVRKHTAAPNLDADETPHTYLFVRFGILPAQLIEEYRAKGAVKDAGWYNAAFINENVRKAGLGERWNMRLLYERTLPDKSEVDILLKHRTHGSRTLNASDLYSEEDAREVVDSLYAALADPAAIEELPDVSHEVLEESSSRPVIALHELVLASHAEQQQRDAQPGRASGKLILP